MTAHVELLTSTLFGELHHVSARRVRALASTGRIAGALKHGRDWLIPAQADVAAGNRGPLSNSARKQQRARAFKSIEQLSRHQQDAEVGTALKVQLMNDRERVAWLREAWRPLQRHPLARPLPRALTARRYLSIQDKNRHDEAAEVSAAVALARERKRP
ncbi:MAG: hypothetical protein ABI771_15840 [Betaproteobacteria bacterium]